MKRLLFFVLAVFTAGNIDAVRSSAPVKGIHYNHSQPFSYNGSMALLVGAESNTNPNGALSVALLTPSFGTDGSRNASFIPLATDPSLQGTSVQDLAVSSMQPVIALKDATKNNSVYMITDPVTGSVLASPVLKDAAGSDITNGVVSVAGSNNFVFALVGQAGKAFDSVAANDRGVAVIKKATESATAAAHDAAAAPSGLVQLNASDFAATDGLAAARLDVTTTSQLFSFVDVAATNPIAQASVGTSASMVWDEKFQRLYVGLSGVSRDNATREGGCLSVAMGLLDQQANGGASPSLRFVPIVKDIKKQMFYVNNGYAAHYAAAVQLAYELRGLAEQINDMGGNVSANLLSIFKNATVDPFLSYINRVKQDLPVWPASGGPLNSGNLTNPVTDLVTTASSAVVFGSLAAGGPDKELEAIRLAIPLSDKDKSINRYRESAKASATGLVNGVADNFANPVFEYVNGLNNIFGFYYDGTSLRKTSYNATQALHDGNDDVSISANKLCVMHTSTNRSYLILESIIANNLTSDGGFILEEAEDWIYALPLIDTAINGDPETLGSIPKVDSNGVPIMVDSLKKIVLQGGNFQVPLTFADMPKANHTAIRVAVSNPVPGSWIDQLFVVGDSVYMGLVGPNTNQRGMYKSTAIFGDNGFIAGWTPAERVMGFVADVFTGGMDAQTGNFYAVTDGGTVGRVTDWGAGDPTLHGGSSATLLGTVLSDIFEQTLGGVHQLIPFDKTCPAFDNEKIAISVAIGRNGIALIQTGAEGPQGFVPTTAYVLDSTVLPIPLSQIAPLTSATFVKEGTSGALIVSGFKGIVKLRAPGLISSLSALSASNFISSNPTLKVVASTNGFYALGINSVYQYSAAGGLSSTTSIPNAIDMVVVDDTAIVAAGSGIVTVPGGSLGGVPGRILNMSYLAATSKGLPTSPGNLYVLVKGPLLQPNATGTIITSTKQTATQVYRYALLSGPRITPLDLDASGKPIPYLQFNDPRTLITTDGSILFDSLPKDTGATDFVRLLPITTPQPLASMLVNEYRLYSDLALNSVQNFNVSTISRDPSSGAWMVPGDWGIRVNE